jgi:hypothetical protein
LKQFLTEFQQPFVIRTIHQRGDFIPGIEDPAGEVVVGCTGFAEKIFSLQSETKRNEIRLARSREKIFRFISLLFASNFSLPTKAK